MKKVKEILIKVVLVAGWVIVILERIIEAMSS